MKKTMPLAPCILAFVTPSLLAFGGFELQARPFGDYLDTLLSSITEL